MSSEKILKVFNNYSNNYFKYQIELLKQGIDTKTSANRYICSLKILFVIVIPIRFGQNDLPHAFNRQQKEYFKKKNNTNIDDFRVYPEFYNRNEITKTI